MGEFKGRLVEEALYSYRMKEAYECYERLNRPRDYSTARMNYLLHGPAKIAKVPTHILMNRLLRVSDLEKYCQ